MSNLKKIEKEFDEEFKEVLPNLYIQLTASKGWRWESEIKSFYREKIKEMLEELRKDLTNPLWEEDENTKHLIKLINYKIDKLLKDL